jgi:hypothetical protein
MADEGGGMRERELTIGNGALGVGGWLVVGEAAKVVLRNVGKVRSVSQQIGEHETTLSTCSPISALGGSASSMQRHFGE